MKPIRLKAIDFFCGAGGVTSGFKQAGIEVLGGVDIDIKCKATYELNNSAKFFNVDVASCDKKQLGKYFRIRKNQRDLIFVGCSPCQYFSRINTEKSKSKVTRYLLSDFQEFVAYYRPGYVFIENVPGIETQAGSPLKKFKTFLKKNGYVFDGRVVNAKYFGVPQNRKRYVLVASRVKKTIKLPDELKGELKTVRDSIGDKKLFKPIKAGNTDKTEFLHSSAILSPLNIKRIKSTPHNGGDRRSWPDKLKPNCSKNHNGHTDVYGRMFWDKPSPALTTKYRSLSNGRYGHPEQNRAISLREGAVLQSFPLNYQFIVTSQMDIAKMIGNAVPPKLAKELSKSFF